MTHRQHRARTRQRCECGCTAVSTAVRSPRYYTLCTGYRRSTRQELVSRNKSRAWESTLTGFFSIRQRMHAPRFLTSWTSFRLVAENLPRTLGFEGLVAFPKSFTKPLACEFGLIAIGRGYAAARCAVDVNVGSCSCRLSKSSCSEEDSCWFGQAAPVRAIASGPIAPASCSIAIL